MMLAGRMFLFPCHERGKGAPLSCSPCSSEAEKNEGTETEGKFMMIQVGYELVFQVPAHTPMLLVLYTHPSRAASLREVDQVHVEPGVPVEEFLDHFGNRCGRLVAPPGKLRLWNMTLIEDRGVTDEGRYSPQKHPFGKLPNHVFP